MIYKYFLGEKVIMYVIYTVSIMLMGDSDKSDGRREDKSMTLTQSSRSLLFTKWERSGSVVEPAWLKIERMQVRVSPVALYCALEQDTLF